MKLPTGWQELLIALATPTPKGPWGVPALVWGGPGTGKSTFVESLARDGFPVLTMIASLHDPTDFNGLPTLRDGRMHFAPPDWVYAFEESQQGILFLDELTTAPPTVQAALLRLVLERKVGMHSLPPKVRILAAANPPDIAASGWELSTPLANRFVHIHWDLENETYLHALDEGFENPELYKVDAGQHAERSIYWRSVVQSFLKRTGQLYTKPAEGEYAYATPRSWDVAIALSATCDLLGFAPRPGVSQGELDHTPFVRLITGTLGGGAGTSFLQHLRQLRIPDPEEVLEGKAEVAASLRDDELHTLFTAMAGIILQRRQSSKLADYVGQFLKAAQGVASNGKADSAYTSIRRLVKQHAIQEVVRNDKRVHNFLLQLGKHYEGLLRLLEGGDGTAH